ncbi:hypothetical protein ACKI1O_50890, partial [Streptomyces scabiei]
ADLANSNEKRAASSVEMPTGNILATELAKGFQVSAVLAGKEPKLSQQPKAQDCGDSVSSGSGVLDSWFELG